MNPRPSCIVVLAAVLGCASAAPVARQSEVCSPEVGAASPRRIDGGTAKKLVAAGARLVDVRAPDFFAQGHIDGAINIPWQAIGERAAEIGPPERTVVVYCRTGAGSSRAAATLARLGYQNVYDLGSYLNWGEGAPPATPLPAPH